MQNIEIFTDLLPVVHPWSLLLCLLAVFLRLLLEGGRVLEPGLLLPAVLEEGVVLQPGELTRVLPQEALQVAGAARLLELLVLELVVITTSTPRELEHVALSAVARVGGWRLRVTWTEEVIVIVS